MRTPSFQSGTPPPPPRAARPSLGAPMPGLLYDFIGDRFGLPVKPMSQHHQLTFEGLEDPGGDLDEMNDLCHVLVE